MSNADNTVTPSGESAPRAGQNPPNAPATNAGDSFDAAPGLSVTPTPAPAPADQSEAAKREHRQRAQDRIKKGPAQRKETDAQADAPAPDTSSEEEENARQKEQARAKETGKKALNVKAGVSAEGLETVLDREGWALRKNLRGGHKEFLDDSGEWKVFDKETPEWLIEEIVRRGYKDASKKGKKTALRFPESRMRTAAANVAKTNEVDPFLSEMGYERLKELNGGRGWNGVPVIEHIPRIMFGADDDIFSRWAGMYLFIAPIARAMKPGCELHEMPLFVSETGIGKSTFFRKLFLPGSPAAWVQQGFSINPRVADWHKQAYQDLCRCVIAEYSELANIKHTTVEVVKAFLTYSVDTVTLKWELAAKPFLRRFVIVGTSNPCEMLPDDRAMLRRIVTVRCNITGNEHLDESIRWFVKVRLQCWLEAWERYLSGERPYWGFREDETMEGLIAHNEEYRDSDDLENTIKETAWVKGECYRLREIAHKIGLTVDPTHTPDRAMQNRIKARLANIGARPGKGSNSSGKRWRGYRFPDALCDPAAMPKDRPF